MFSADDGGEQRFVTAIVEGTVRPIERNRDHESEWCTCVGWVWAASPDEAEEAYWRVYRSMTVEPWTVVIALVPLLNDCRMPLAVACMPGVVSFGEVTESACVGEDQYPVIVYAENEDDALSAAHERVWKMLQA